MNTPSRKKTILSQKSWFRSIAQKVSGRSGSLSHSTLNILTDERKQASDPTFETGRYLCFIGHKKPAALDFRPHINSRQCGRNLYDATVTNCQYTDTDQLFTSSFHCFTCSLQDRILQDRKGTWDVLDYYYFHYLRGRSWS